jgi:hypothetical protein
LIRPHVKDTNKAKIAAFAVGGFLLAVVHISPISVLLLAAVIGAILPQAKQT